MDGNVKEFHLIAEPVKQEIVPGESSIFGVTTGALRGQPSSYQG